MTLRHRHAVVSEIARLASEGIEAREIGERLGMTQQAVFGVCRRRGIRLGKPLKPEAPRVRVAPPPNFAREIVSEIPPPSRERLMAGR